MPCGLASTVFSMIPCTNVPVNSVVGSNGSSSWRWKARSDSFYRLTNLCSPESIRGFGSKARLMMSSVVNKEVAESRSILSGPSESRDFPDWFRDQQRAAWQQFETLPNPTRKDQPWRFSNVGLLDLAPFRISLPLSEDDRNNVLKYSRGLDEH